MYRNTPLKLVALFLFSPACTSQSPVAPSPSEVASIRITSSVSQIRQGDVTVFDAEVRNTQGTVIRNPDIAWGISPRTGGHIDTNGTFVAYTPGTVEVIARIGTIADSLNISIYPRGLSGSFEIVGRGLVSERGTSDLWVHGDYAYTGTFCRGNKCGDRIYVWDIGLPTTPIRIDSVVVNARQVNDVKIRADGALGVMTHEQSGDGVGVTIFDLADPAHPQIIAQYAAGLESGVHNTWIEGNYLYAIVDPVIGTYSGELHIIDISDPANPVTVSRFYGGSSYPHDIYVRDGLAFVSHQDAGLIILDVGNGRAGGSVVSPVEISRVGIPNGHVHNAWYWSERNYVLVGQEDESLTPGRMYVVDVRDLNNPEIVATFSKGESTTVHNFWLDEENEVLYMAWYSRGVNAVDVSGELLGQLELQGREKASRIIEGGSIFSPQLHREHVYISDTFSGLIVLKPSFG